MEREYFLALEKLKNNSSLALNEVIEQLAFNEQGLIPVITQDAKTKTMLMFAWMNMEALHKTLATKKVTYWSRSRQQLWVKGETSGHVQRVISMSFDCDGDAILCQVEQQGAPCHTGRKSWFYLNVESENQQVIVNEDHA